MHPEPTHGWTVRPEDAWRLLVEPMSEGEARTAATAINQAHPHVHAMVVDPRELLLLAWDRASVAMFIEALDTLADAGRPVPTPLLADLREWLTRARSTDLEDGWTTDGPVESS